MRRSLFVIMTILLAAAVTSLSAVHRKKTVSSAGQSLIGSASMRAVTLTYNVSDNERFKEELLQQLGIIHDRLAGRLCLPLLPGRPLAPPAACPVLDRVVPVIHVVLLRDGEIHRFFSTHPSLFEKPTPVGSITKATIGVPMLAWKGLSVQEPWCQERFAGFRNADGFRGFADCTSPHAVVSAFAAIKKSDNLAAIYKLRRLPQDAMRAELRELGLANVPADFHPGIAIGDGIFPELSARQILEIFDALSSGVARHATVTTKAGTQPSEVARWAANTVTDPARRAYVHGLLRAPAEPGGTAAHLNRVLPAGTTNIIAKTGTPVNEQAFDTGKLLVASFNHGGHRYTFLTAVLSPTPSAPLSPKIYGADFAPLHSVVARHLN